MEFPRLAGFLLDHQQHRHHHEHGAAPGEMACLRFARQEWEQRERCGYTARPVTPDHDHHPGIRDEDDDGGDHDDCLDPHPHLHLRGHSQSHWSRVPQSHAYD